MNLESLRQEIDNYDKQIIKALAERMLVVEKVAETKKAANATAMQKNRWQELLATRSEWGQEVGLPKEDIKQIFECIHDMSVSRQLQILEDN
ncbi:MAG: chorismate mutase [Cyclobacteriaceae bacterium]